MLAELGAVEQRYRRTGGAGSAGEGVSVTEVARRCGVVRQTVHGRRRLYAEGGGLGGLADWPSAGVVPASDARRWNWRQARRTQLREDTTTALFILDALDPVTGEGLHAAADDLTARLAGLGPAVRTARRLIAPGYLCGGSAATTG